jgi:hypothetical protein
MNNNEEKKEITINIDPDEQQWARENFWKSCCGSTIDKRAASFFTQLGISSVVIIFCLYKLVVHTGDCSESQTYMSLLTLILGIYIPNPKIRK